MTNNIRMSRRKTHEEFVREVFHKVGKEYTVIGRYVKAIESIEMKHEFCGHIWKTRPANFLSGRRCPICKGERIAKVRRKTQDIFMNDMLEKHGSAYEVLGEYVNCKTKLEIRHTLCGHKWKVTPNSVLSGTGCPACGGTKQKTPQEFNDEVYNLAKHEFTVIGKYENSKKKIEMKHNKCGNVFFITPDSFLQGVRCSFCNGGALRTQKEFENIVKASYDVIGTYKNNMTPIQVRHKKCGYVFAPVAYSILDTERCPRCSGKERKTPARFEEEISNIVGTEYIVLSNYENVKSKVIFKHSSCNTVFEMLPGAFLKGQRCPKCNESKGEKSINDYLRKINIKHLVQEKFENCRRINPLPFDTYINDQFLLEYDGEDHFYPIDRANKGEEWAISSHHLRIENDKIKNQYCIDNNIPLLRIPYWEFDNIETILESTLMHYDIIEKTDTYSTDKFMHYIVDENWDHDAYIAKCPKNQRELMKLDVD